MAFGGYSGGVVAAAEVTTERIPVGQTELYLLKGGQGRACLVLHGIEGHEGWLSFHQALAEHATVYAPSHPGYGHTPAPDWISSIQHQAVFYLWFLQASGLDNVDLVGTGIGGWIAAQMAVMCSDRLRSLTLIDAAGIKPEQAEIFDVFIARWRDVIELGFVDAPTSPEYQRIYGATPIQEFGGIREAGRTMSMRMCFKPYMYDPALPGMLAKIDVPTLVIHGQNDRIMPLECASLYQQAIPHATLKLLENCGHFAHLDRPEDVAQLVSEFTR
jgi:pimeloyl-ACP methyl ester carboxylesterase